jgi:hypothetical protein
MYKFISPTGEIIKTKTVKDFAKMTGMRENMARILACGVRARLQGYCSTHPRAKKYRERFTTVLVNMRTGEKSIIGPSLKKFAKDHGLSYQCLVDLVNHRLPIYRYWVIEHTLKVANPNTAISFN